MFRIKKWMSVLFASCLLFSMPVFADSEVIPEEQMQSEVPNYKTDTATYRDIDVRVRTQGAQFMSTVSYLFHEGAAVHYEETLVKNGDFVEKGDPVLKVHAEVSDSAIYEKELAVKRINEEAGRIRSLAGIDLSELQKALNEAEDDTSRAILSLRIQKRNTELSRAIYENNIQLKKAEKELEKLTEVRDTEYIYADSTGYVSDLQYFEENTIISEGTRILTIEQSDNSYITIGGNAFQYGMKVHIGSSAGNANISLDGHVVVAPSAIPEANFSGSIIQLDLTEEQAKELKKMLSSLNARGGDYSYILRSLDLEGEAILKNVLVLNRDCKTTDSGKNYLQIVDTDGYIHKRYFKEGGSNQEEIWILEGVKEGDRVIIND